MIHFCVNLLNKTLMLTATHVFHATNNKYSGARLIRTANARKNRGITDMLFCDISCW